MALQAENMADMVALTLRELGRGKWTDLTTDIQEFIIMPKILKKDKVKFDGGYGHQFQVQVNTNGNARNVGLYSEDVTNVGDTMKNATVPFRHTTNNWSFDEHEPSMNKGPAKIVDLVKTRRHASYVDLAEKMEQDGWGKPTDSSDDLTPWGIQYWITRNATAGFTALAPAGFGDKAGLSPSTYARWRNWSAQYVSVTKTDLIDKMSEAADKTNFKAPIAQPSYSTGDKWGCYCNWDTKRAFEKIGESQNENLGRDIDSMAGKMLFRSRPFQYVPYLDADTTDPIFMLNWGVFFPTILEGWNMKETGPIRAPRQHNVFDVFNDISWNLCCKDLRAQAVFYK